MRKEEPFVNYGDNIMAKNKLFWKTGNLFEQPIVDIVIDNFFERVVSPPDKIILYLFCSCFNCNITNSWSGL